MFRTRTLLLLLAGALASASCYPGQADIRTGEMILGLTDAMTDLEMESAILQEQIDSLTIQVARQDSIIRRISEHVGMPLPR